MVTSGICKSSRAFELAIEMCDIGALLETACARQDLAQHRQNYRVQDEFVVVENFLPVEILTQWSRELHQLKPHIHRNFIPKHKKGGSVAYSSVCRLGPTITA